MRDELRKTINFLFKDKRGKNYLIYGLILIISSISFYAINYFFIIKNTESSNFFNAYASARFVFLEGLNPYREINTRLVALAAENNIEFIPKEPAFGLPFFTLFLYFPFSISSNYLAAQALWMTCNQMLLLYLLYIVIKLLDWKIKITIFWCLALIAIFFYSNWFNVMNQNLSIIQAAILLTSMYYEKRDMSILSGVFLGLCFINPFYFIAPTILYIYILIKKQNSAAVLWMMITLVLLFLSSIIINSSWFLDYLRVMVLEPSIFPFKPSAENFALTIGATSNALWNIIPLAAMIWMIAEWLRTPLSQFKHQFWLVSLSFILGQFITVQPDPINSVLFFPVFIFLVYLWEIRIKNLSKIYIYILGILFSFGVLAINYFITRDLFLISNFQVINIITGILLVLNLYWVRVWAISTYSLDAS